MENRTGTNMSVANNRPLVVIVAFGRTIQEIKDSISAHLAAHGREPDFLVVRAPHDDPSVGITVEQAVETMKATLRVLLVANSGATEERTNLLLAAAPLPHVEIVNARPASHGGTRVIRAAVHGVDALLACQKAVEAAEQLRGQMLCELIGPAACAKHADFRAEDPLHVSDHRETPLPTGVEDRVVYEDQSFVVTMTDPETYETYLYQASVYAAPQR